MWSHEPRQVYFETLEMQAFQLYMYTKLMLTTTVVYNWMTDSIWINVSKCTCLSSHNQNFLYPILINLVSKYLLLLVYFYLPYIELFLKYLFYKRQGTIWSFFFSLLFKIHHHCLKLKSGMNKWTNLQTAYQVQTKLSSRDGFKKNLLLSVGSALFRPVSITQRASQNFYVDRHQSSRFFDAK